MWDLPGPGIEPVSLALAGGFLTTAPPGKPKRNKLLIYWYMQQFRWISRELCWVKTPNPKRSQYWMIPFIWHSWNDKIIEMGNKWEVTRSKEVEAGQTGVGVSGCGHQRPTWGILVKELLCIVTVSMSILGLWECANSFARCYHWKNWVEVLGISLYYFLGLHINLQLSLNQKFN